MRGNNRLRNNKSDDDNVQKSYVRLSIRNDPKSIPNNSDFVVDTSNDNETKKIPIKSNCSDSSFIAIVDETVKKDKNQVSKTWIKCSFYWFLIGFWNNQNKTNKNKNVYNAKINRDGVVSNFKKSNYVN